MKSSSFPCYYFSVTDVHCSYLYSENRCLREEYIFFPEFSGTLSTMFGNCRSQRHISYISSNALGKKKKRKLRTGRDDFRERTQFTIGAHKT